MGYRLHPQTRPVMRWDEAVSKARREAHLDEMMR